MELFFMLAPGRVSNCVPIIAEFTKAFVELNYVRITQFCSNCYTHPVLDTMREYQFQYTIIGVATMYP